MQSCAQVAQVGVVHETIAHGAFARLLRRGRISAACATCTPENTQKQLKCNISAKILHLWRCTACCMTVYTVCISENICTVSAIKSLNLDLGCYNVMNCIPPPPPTHISETLIIGMSYICIT